VQLTDIAGPGVAPQGVHDVRADREVLVAHLGQYMLQKPGDVLSAVFERRQVYGEHADSIGGAVPYMDYVRNIRDSGNPVAIGVKLADLRHNSDPARMGDEGERTVERRARYRAAMEMLGGAGC